MVCGRAAISQDYENICHRICDTLAHIIICCHWGGQKPTSDLLCWRRRDFNKEADFLANQAMNRRGDLEWSNPDLHALHQKSISICGWSDGGSRTEDSISSFAWILKAWHSDKQQWFTLSLGAKFLNRPASSLEVESLG
eukprot:12413908-Karenia_brevis.AAC.1